MYLYQIVSFNINVRDHVYCMVSDKLSDKEIKDVLDEIFDGEEMLFAFQLSKEEANKAYELIHRDHLQFTVIECDGGYYETDL